MKMKIEKPRIVRSLDERNLNLLLENDDIIYHSFSNQIINKKTITGIEFNECIFNKIDFATNCVCFKNTRFIDIIFENCDFSNANFELCSFKRCKFINCKLLGANIFNSSLFDVSFYGMLSYINFADNKLNNVEFNECNLEEARFLENKMKNLSFELCNIQKTEFIKCDLTGVNLTTCNFDDLKINPEYLNGVIMNSYQACLIARKLGIVIEG